jgi:hypothetical protein
MLPSALQRIRSSTRLWVSVVSWRACVNGSVNGRGVGVCEWPGGPRMKRNKQET